MQYNMEKTINLYFIAVYFILSKCELPISYYAYALCCSDGTSQYMQYHL